jgi:signal transduction histidine kinase
MAGQMWRVVAIFRVAMLGYAAFLVIRDHHAYAHPAAGIAALAVMTCWTAVTLAAYARPGGRRAWLIAADVAIAAALVVSTRWVAGRSLIAAGEPTLPVFWAASPVLACAVAGGPWAGIGGALVISAADLAEQQTFRAQSNFEGLVLLLIAGGIGGYVVRLGLRAEEAAGRAARREAAVAERERIARGIHDSVLQILALVSRRGRELGGEAAELGRLAAEQESALRTLVSADGAGAGRQAGLADVRALAESQASTRVTVSCPATAVLLPAAASQALGAAAAAALDNVRRHAGPDAHAWVLVEDEGNAVRMTVRDDGPGFEHGRLDAAAAAGRLGVSQSITGRLRSVGGTATVTSAPGQGTEVELIVPRR